MNTGISTTSIGPDFEKPSTVSLPVSKVQDNLESWILASWDLVEAQQKTGISAFRRFGVSAWRGVSWDANRLHPFLRLKN